MTTKRNVAVLVTALAATLTAVPVAHAALIRPPVCVESTTCVTKTRPSIPPVTPVTQEPEPEPLITPTPRIPVRR